MRRIYACVLVLAAGGLGLGLMRSLAQPVEPAPISPYERPIAESRPSRDARPPNFDDPMPVRGVAVSDSRPALTPRFVTPEPKPPVANPPGAVEAEPLPAPVPPRAGAPADGPAPPSSLPMLDPAAIPAPPKPAPAAAPKPEQATAVSDIILPTLPAPEPMKPAPVAERVNLTVPAPPAAARPVVKVPTAAPPEPKERETLIVPQFPAPEQAAPTPAPAERTIPASAPAPAERQPVPVIPVAPRASATPSRGVAPSVSVEAIVPETVGVGQQLNYEIVVKNVGPVQVHQVRIEDELPQSMRYIGGDPVAEVNGEHIGWSLGSMDVGVERRVKVVVKPGADGDWRSRPQVTFSAIALPVQVRVTKPKITVAVAAPEAASVGEEIPFQIRVTNSGTGPAHEVQLKAQLSEGLQHPQGSVIQAELRGVAVGETRTVTLKTLATQVGPQGCALAAVADGASEAATRSAVQLSPPTLHLKLGGPGRALVRAEPAFTVEVSNSGPTATTPVQLAVAFPEGLEFVSATEGGTFDAASRLAAWTLPAVPAGGTRTLSMKTRAGTVGNWAVRAVARAGQRSELKAEAVVQVDGVPALTFEVVSVENPVEVGKEGTYEIRVVNQGTCACTNVRLAMALTEGLTPTAVTAPVGHRVEGPTIVFEPIPRMAVRADAVVRVRVKGDQPGDQRCRVQLSCDQIKQPVVKEESTSFYSSQ